MLHYELKNRRSGRIYWVSKEELDQIATSGLIGRFIVTELKSLKTITSPQDFKVIRHDRERKKDSQ